MSASASASPSVASSSTPPSPPSRSNNSHAGHRTKAPPLVLLAEGALASIGATFFSNPFEVIKTRLQLQGELKKRGEYVVQYKGMFHGMAKVAREEGLIALQKGLVPSLFHQTAQNGVRFGVFPHAQALTASMFLGRDHASDAKPPLYVNVIAGAGVGVVGCVIGSPFFMIKTRLQAQNKSAMLKGKASEAVGAQHHYNGTFDAFKKVIGEKGFFGLFHGVSIAMQRTAVGSAAQLASYEWAKQFITAQTSLSERDLRVHVLSSVFASAAVVATMNPMDVVMIRRYAQASNTHSAAQQSEGMASAILNILKTEGVHGLYKGSIPLFSRMAPHFIATFIFLEQIRGVRIRYYEEKEKKLQEKH